MNSIRELTTDEKILIESQHQGSDYSILIRRPNIIFKARLNGVPDTSDMVLEINFDDPTGTLANVRNDMTLFLGSVEEGKDLGVLRIRKEPISGTFYVSENSDVTYIDNSYITIVDDIRLVQKHLKIIDREIFLDGDIEYDDQHVDFDPIIIMGTHKVKRYEGIEIFFDFDASESYVFDSTMASYHFEAPDCSSISGENTATPEIGFSQTGSFPIYCTGTAANGKSTTAVRYVFIPGEGYEPLEANITKNPLTNSDKGSWDYSVSVIANSPDFLVEDNIRGSLVLLTSKDVYNGIEQFVSHLEEDSKSIVVVGRIQEGGITINPINSELNFTVQQSKHFLEKLNSFPIGLELALKVPSLWVTMTKLNVDRFVWHCLHWRSNLTELCDFHISGDTRYALEFASPEGSLYNQVLFASESIFSRLFFHREDTCYLRIEQQLTLDRGSFVEPFEISKDNWIGSIDITLKSPETAQVYLSGVKISPSGQPGAFFSLAPGHIPFEEGDIEFIENVLLSSQTQSNALAGTYLGWKNRLFESIQMSLYGNIKMIDIGEYQLFPTTISPEDNAYGISFNGNLVLRSLELVLNEEYPHLFCIFEDESNELQNINGDIPVAAGGVVYDVSFPPMSPFPPIPVPPLEYLPVTEETGEMPKKVLIRTSNYGYAYSENVDAIDPADIIFKSMNSGFLDPGEELEIGRTIKTSTGRLYCKAKLKNPYGFESYRRVYTCMPGYPWQLVFDVDDIDPKKLVMDLNVNYNSEDEIGVIIGENEFFPFSPGTFNLIIITGLSINLIGADISNFVPFKFPVCALSHSGESWYFLTTSLLYVIDPDGTVSNVLDTTGYVTSDKYWINIGSTNKKFVYGSIGDHFVVDGEVFGSPLDVDGNHVLDGGFNFWKSMAASPGGLVVIAVTNEDTTNAYISSDGGITWTVIATMAFSKVLENCGDDFRFLFFVEAFQEHLYVTLDQGLTSEDITGNLEYIMPSFRTRDIIFIE